MRIINVIRQRGSVRNYTKKRLSTKVLEKIITAGIWGPSIHGVQSSKYIVIQNKKTIAGILSIIEKKAKEIHLPGFLLNPTAKALVNAQALICVFNTKRFSSFATKVSLVYKKNAQAAELSSISAAIQNMLLVAHSLRIGSCWLNIPVFSSDAIANLCGCSDELVAIITLGYPAEEIRRAPRRSLTERVIFLK